MRNLTKTLAVISLLAPVNGHSLGIGEIKLRSALNQNLNAEILLVVSAGESVSDIKVNLAPPDKFTEAGVPWATFLSKIKFTTVAIGKGSVLVKLSSKDAVKEPFLDFLLEVSWPKGSLYREFTVLLDPPVAYEPTAIPVLTRSESYEPESAALPNRPLTPANQQENVGRNSGAASQYGPTHKNDTLWKVAERASVQEGVSVEQMMVAMYEKNPQAFYKENVHALLAGKTLKIPARDVVLKFSRKQALAEYNRQTKAWRTRLAPAPIEVATAKQEAPDNQLTLIAPTKADVADNANVAPEKGQVAATQATPARTPPAVALPANDALQSKIAELEKQLAMMQQILALKDQQLAILQNQPQPQPTVASKPEQATPSQAKVVSQAPPAQPTAKPEPQATSSTNIDYPKIGTGVGVVTLTLLGWLWWRKRQQDKRNLLDEEEVPDFFTTLIEKGSVKGSDSGGESSFFSEFTFGDLDTFDTDQNEIDPVSEADVYLAYGRYQQAEELMRDVIKGQPGRDDYKLKLLEIFYSNENKQAFEAYAKQLAEAGKKDNLEFWAKVTEMGSEICQDSPLFSLEIERPYPNKKIGPAKTTEPVIGPDETEAAMPAIDENDFGVSSFTEPFNGEATQEVKGPLALGSASEGYLVDDGQANNGGADFGLSAETSSDMPESFLFKAKDSKVDNEFESFDFDFDLNEDALKEAIEPPKMLESFLSKARGNKVDDEFESFDFDFGLNEEAPKEPIEPPKMLEGFLSEAQDNKVDDEFESFDFDFGLNEEALKEPIEPPKFTDKLIDEALGNNFANGEFYFDPPDSGLNGHYFGQRSGLGVFDLTDMDELETKIDLAKAYLDMSDTDAAKEMAYDVIEKGTTEQKKIAQVLLNDLE